MENLHYFASRGEEVFTHDHMTFVSSLLRGDFFLCASEAQRLFYLGALLAVGRVNPMTFESDAHFDSLIRIAPFGVEPARPLPSQNLTPPAVLFGGVYDWYDPILAIDAVAAARATIPGISLTFTRHPNPSITPQGKLAAAIEHSKTMRYDFVRFEPWTPYTDRGSFFDRFALALLTFPQSVETDLSMRTRIYDYLWGGLPIVTSSAPGTDELLARYGAGAVVTEQTPDSFASALVAILQNAGRHASMREATRQFVEEHQWSHALEPLREFCRAPRFDRTKEAFAARLQIPERPTSILDRLKRRIGGAL